MSIYSMTWFGFIWFWFF